jgi:hypothetical protein
MMSTTPRTPSTPTVRGKRTQRKPLFVSPISARKVDPSNVVAKGKDPKSYFGKFLIMLVLEENLDDLATFIAEKGADPNFVDPDDFTPLYVAAKHKLNECAKTLVQQGAIITKKTKSYPSPLQLAIQTQNTELVEFFEGWLHTAETEWAAARREAVSGSSTSGDQPSRKRRRVETEPVENGGNQDGN